MAPRRNVVIVGGGPGGLCAAMLLSARGFDVTVLEKRETLGGRSGVLRLGDYAFDVGSTMLMMPFVLHEMFELANARLGDEVELIRLEPMYRLVFGARHLDVFSDPRRMEAELRRFAPGSEPGLTRFLRQEHARLRALYPVLQKSWPNLASLADPDAVNALPHVGLGTSLHDTARGYFDDEALQLGFSFQSAYLGMSPWDCPGGFGMVPYVEHAWGIDYARGGLHSLCTAMARVAERNGAKLRVNAEVTKLETDGERCTAVVLKGGERLEVEDLIIDSDATASLLRLLDRDVSFRFSKRRLRQLEESCSTFMLYLGLDVQLPWQHHTFFFADDYRDEMKRVFHIGALSDDFSLYVCNPSRTDASVAPEGHSALYALALVPNTRFGIDWAEEAPRMRARVMRALSRHAEFDLSPHVRAEYQLTPRDWESAFQVSHGAVFGPSHGINQLLAFRPPNKLPSFDNVFLTGGGTSPGSGLPTIFESARISSRLLCQRHGVSFPASKPLPAPETWGRERRSETTLPGRSAAPSHT